ncbi:MAG: biopolymer transporter ExbD [Alphaproteobacteria bacterium]|nr:biopolymer transporter ExbD [Alphaproteobacteria bacterium]
MARSSRRRDRIKSEVNLTPLIDVMMSLLAIFMITAPMLTTGIPLTLPKGDGQNIEGEQKTLDISISAQNDIYIGSNKVPQNQLVKKVRAIVSENPKIGIIISGDTKSDYGRVIEVMALLRTAGFTQVGLKTDAKIMHDTGA